MLSLNRPSGNRRRRRGAREGDRRGLREGVDPCDRGCGVCLERREGPSATPTGGGVQSTHVAGRCRARSGCWCLTRSTTLAPGSCRDDLNVGALSRRERGKPASSAHHRDGLTPSDASSTERSSHVIAFRFAATINRSPARRRVVIVPLAGDGTMAVRSAHAFALVTRLGDQPSSPHSKWSSDATETLGGTHPRR